MRWLAIDTSAVVGEGFEFRGPRFTALKNRAELGEVRLLLPDLLDREIRKHIIEDTRAAVKHLDKAHVLKAAGLFDYETVRVAVAAGSAERAIEAHWDEFVAAMNAERVSIDDVKPTLVMNKYFEQVPPFGPEKRKEFPDAFAIERLRAWATDNDCEVHVVSDDGDWAKACDGKRLIHWKRIADFLAVLLQEAADAELRELALAFLRLRVDELQEELRYLFLQLSVDFQHDSSAELGEVHVRTLEIDDFEVIDQGPDGVQVEGVARVSFEVEAQIGVDDYWGNYDTRWFTFPRPEQELRFVVSVTVAGDPPGPADYEEVSIVEPRQIDVNAEWDTRFEHDDTRD